VSLRSDTCNYLGARRGDHAAWARVRQITAASMAFAQAPRQARCPWCAGNRRVDLRLEVDLAQLGDDQLRGVFHAAHGRGDQEVEHLVQREFRSRLEVADTAHVRDIGRAS
jgi:hypothetical protein